MNILRNVDYYSGKLAKVICAKQERFREAIEQAKARLAAKTASARRGRA